MSPTHIKTILNAPLLLALLYISCHAPVYSQKNLIIIRQKYSPTVAISSAAKIFNSFLCKSQSIFPALNLLDKLQADTSLLCY